MRRWSNQLSARVWFNGVAVGLLVGSLAGFASSAIEGAAPRLVFAVVFASIVIIQCLTAVRSYAVRCPRCRHRVPLGSPRCRACGYDQTQRHHPDRVRDSAR